MLCLVEGVLWASQSTIEYGPTDFVAQFLVVKHELPDFAWKLRPLPFALKATSLFTLIFRSRRACGSNGNSQ